MKNNADNTKVKVMQGNKLKKNKIKQNKKARNVCNVQQTQIYHIAHISDLPTVVIS